jgi:hypothetical protein
MEYEHLARGLKQALIQDAHALDAEKLVNVSTETVTSWFHPFVPPQLDERVRKVQEVGEVLLHFFKGHALNLIREANYSAVEAVRLILAYFPGFRDHAVYKGEHVHFYKRAQILIGDVWAAYGRRSTGVGSFHDIDKLTMFGKRHPGFLSGQRVNPSYSPSLADYRVPQLLRPEGVMVYSGELADLVDSKKEIASGSEV